MFFVPKRDRSFQINNADFSFFSIQNATGDAVTSATVPTALGSDTHYYLVGNIDSSQIRMAAPNGVNQETVFILIYKVRWLFGKDLKWLENILQKSN